MKTEKHSLTSLGSSYQQYKLSVDLNFAVLISTQT